MAEKTDSHEIRPGDMIAQMHKEMTQEMINRWAEVADDYNPLHVDPEYAEKTKFKGTIAHGPLLVSYLSEMMTDWLGTDWIEGGQLLDIRFKAPVKPGDKITIGGWVKGERIAEKGRMVDCEVFIENQGGVKVVVGRAIAPVR